GWKKWGGGVGARGPPGFPPGLEKAASFPRSRGALRISINSQGVAAPACKSLTTASLNEELGLTSATKRVAAGASSRNSPSRLATSSTVWRLTPVTLPPGRLGLATRLNAKGSGPER